MTITYTTNREYPKPGFDDEPFIDAIHDFADAVDADIAQLLGGTEILVQVWDNGVAYVLGERVQDPDTQHMFRCLVGHTSPSTNSFADYRLANPTHWEAFGIVINPMGAWAQSTAYGVVDFVYDQSEGISAICTLAHTSTSSGTIRTDAAYWLFLIDLQAGPMASAQFQDVLAAQVYGMG